MAQICPECGHELPNNAQTCNECGCPVENNKPTNTPVPPTPCSYTYDNEAEADFLEGANTLLIWGNRLAVFIAVVCVISGLLTGLQMMRVSGGLGVVLILLYTGLAYVVYHLMMFFIKMARAALRMGVNMSRLFRSMEQYLKEINKKNEVTHGTNPMSQLWETNIRQGYQVS